MLMLPVSLKPGLTLQSATPIFFQVVIRPWLGLTERLVNMGDALSLPRKQNTPTRLTPL